MFTKIVDKRKYIEDSVTYAGLYRCTDCGRHYSDIDDAVNCCTADCDEQVKERIDAEKAYPYD